jgi:hypothetical protein
MTIRNRTCCGQVTTPAEGNYKMPRTRIKHLHEYGYPELGINRQNKRQHIYKVPKTPVEILITMYFWYQSRINPGLSPIWPKDQNTLLTVVGMSCLAWGQISHHWESSVASEGNYWSCRSILGYHMQWGPFLKMVDYCIYFYRNWELFYHVSCTTSCGVCTTVGARRPRRRVWHRQ